MKIPIHELCADLVVVGGGMAGVCTAVAAARNGASVILVQDRPVLGGNASSEIRMCISGPSVREGGLLEELLLENYYLNPTLRYTIWDDVIYSFVKREKNITLLLNTTVEAVRTEHSKIVSVSAWSLLSYVRYEIAASFYADCSGDGILRLSGAEFRQGREARGEFNESLAAVETADRKTMGSTILVQLRKTAVHRPFIAPDWAYHFTDEDMCRKHHLNNLYGNNFWWLEFGGVKDTVHDADAIRDELLKIVYGCWEYLKNHPDGRAREWELDWVSKIPGKRESIRYVGEHILTQHDLEDGGPFRDVVCHGGWPITSNHPPEGFYYRGETPDFSVNPGIYGIPLRSLYSRNITNLLFAGRDISCTHVAMRSTRVMGTCSAMGQAVGTAAALAVRYHIGIREVCFSHIEELQHLLLDQDQFLPGIGRPIPEITMRAEISDEILRNGIDRPMDGADNGTWIEPGHSCWCRFNSPETVSRVRIVSDSDFEDAKSLRSIEGIPEDDPVRRLPGTLVRDFRLEILQEDDRWCPLMEIRDNRRRCLKLFFDPVRCRGIRLIPSRSWDEKASRVHLFGFEAE